MALPQLKIDTTSRTIGEVVRWTTDDDGYYPIELNPPYQRGAVWTETQKVNLIKSVLLGLPIGVLFINHPDRVRFSKRPECVDGQQRLRALAGFMADEFAIPTDWVDDRHAKRVFGSLADGAVTTGPEPYPAVPDGYTAPEIRYSQLTLRGQRSFKGSIIPIYETDLPTQAEAAELYLLINFGGAAQTETDQARAAAVAGRDDG